MNTTELLDQFVTEAREVLETIGQRLLAVERAPDDRELLNDLFRQVHTLKGNCGLFEFKPLERVVHAGEDLLDRVRNASLAYTPEIADALLEAMDYTAELVDLIAQHGRLPDSTDDRARQHASALRAHLGQAVAVQAVSPVPTHVVAATAPAPDVTTATPLPDWVQQLPEALRHGGATGALYRPEAECFFKGEDPWHLAQCTPGLLHLAVLVREPWPAPGDFDCYRCNLDLLIVSSAPEADVSEHFRCMPEQVEIVVLHAPATVAAPATPAADPLARAAAEVLRARLLRLWDDQRSLLARPGITAGTLAATRRVLSHLLDCRAQDHADDDPADHTDPSHQSLHELPPGAAPLARWADAHHPGDSREAGGTPSAVSSSAPQVTAPEALRGVAASGSDEAGGPGGPGGVGPTRMLRVAQDKVDRLMDLIGEMVVAKNALPYLAQRAEEVFAQRELAREIKTQYSVINRIAEDMQHAIMQVRMMPVGTIFQRFGRLVRDLSKKLGKDVQLVIEGEDTEADKNVIESLADPLIHILRNSLDHGIELPAVRLAAGKPAQGTLRVAARQEGDRVILDISDDGAGVDTERVRAKAVERGLIPADRVDTLTEHEAAQLVFLPGFSTAAQISDLSGRGVGMDVVRSAVERINGTVEFSSRRGQGTTLRLTLPLSMAVTNVMMIETASRRFGVPMDLIVETVRVPAEDIHHFKRAMTTVLRGRIVPLRPLGELLGLDQPPRLNADQEHAVLVVRLGNETIGLLVDDFHGTSDIILKPLEGVLAGITGFAGTALMGDGSVLMILNPKELL